MRNWQTSPKADNHLLVEADLAKIGLVRESLRRLLKFHNRVISERFGFLEIWRSVVSLSPEEITGLVNLIEDHRMELEAVLGPGAIVRASPSYSPISELSERIIHGGSRP